MAQKPAEKVKRILVSGATGVIGSAICRRLCRESNIELHMLIRNKEKGNELLKSLSKDCHKNSTLQTHIVDLSNKKSIHQFIENFNNVHDSLHVLINNAAVVNSTNKIQYNNNNNNNNNDGDRDRDNNNNNNNKNKDSNSDEKLEIMFAVNILSYYRLIIGLLPLLSKVYILDKNNFGRVINVASNYSGSLPNLKALPTGEHGGDSFDGNDVYQQTKRANRMLSKMAHDLYHEKYKIGFYACHPGVTKSNVLDGLGFGGGFDTPEQSATTSVFLATSDQVKLSDSGKYYVRNGDSNATGKADDRASNTKLNQELWDLCSKYA